MLLQKIFDHRFERQSVSSNRLGFGAGRRALCSLAFVLPQFAFQAQELIEGFLVGDQSQRDQFPARPGEYFRLQTQQLCDSWTGVIA